jgi:hypothetical protein
MLVDLMASAITFRKATTEKIAFISLNVMDLVLTLFAMNLGADEMNPVMRGMIHSPAALYTAKLLIPLCLAWLLPGKLLIPSIAVLVFVVGWDTRELLVFFF